jgi:hypothetical protein
VARNQKVEELLEAWWQAEHCPPNDRAERLEHLYSLIDSAIAGQPITRDAVLDRFYGQYKDFKIQRLRDEKLGVARSAGK